GGGMGGWEEENGWNGVEECSGGACVAGVPLSSDDGDLCTDDSVCDPATGYVHTPITGFASVTCRFDTMDAVLAKAGAGDISPGLRRSFQRAVAKARAQG